MDDDTKMEPPDTKYIGKKETIVMNGVGGSNATTVPVEEELVTVSREKHLQGRLVFMASLITIVLISLSIVSLPWILPYYYTVFAPTLIIIRLVQYWQLKQQFYLIDFCYFTNAALLVFLWAFPDNRFVFTVLFGLSHGPLMWAVLVFRNSAVFHSTDKMTSLFIHLVPPYVLYCIRWYPERTSEFWYTSFVTHLDVNVASLFIWLLAVPFACFICHSLIYAVLIYGVFRPSEEYGTIFRYVSQKAVLKLFIGVLGPDHQLLMYNLFNWMYSITTLALTPLWFISFPADSAFIAAATCATFWNGAGYYLRVFRTTPSSTKNEMDT